MGSVKNSSPPAPRTPEMQHLRRGGRSITSCFNWLVQQVASTKGILTASMVLTTMFSRSTTRDVVGKPEVVPSAAYFSDRHRTQCGLPSIQLVALAPEHEYRVPIPSTLEISPSHMVFRFRHTDALGGIPAGFLNLDSESE
ncbi:hypothetical protein G7046_g9301 [Stylonectria norvegica]|nr:hypothetical protein G7046_g9301 [Stylonectria norvegica]